MARKVPAPPQPTGLYFAREHRGMSQDELAIASGAKKPMISKLESGARELTRAWAERFAAPLGISAIRIVFWDKVGELEPNAKEGEYDIPNPKGWMASPLRDLSKAPSPKTTTSRQKPLKSSVVKVYVYEWRDFMGVKIETGAKAINVSIDDYEELESHPFRFTADQLGKLGKAFGVHLDQFLFPVSAARLTESQKKLPAGIKLLKSA